MKYDKTKETNYNYWQNEFDSHSSYMLAAEHNEYAILRDFILNFIDDGDSVLDVGCASGDTFGWAIKKGKTIDYRGVDYAEKFIEANKKRFPQTKWAVMDARYLKELSGSRDIVILYDVLDGMEGWELALKEAIRVAKKRVIVLMWMDANMQEKIDYMRDNNLSVIVMDIEGDGFHYHKFLVGSK